ncbi:CPBP family glutamic-type intramembrane protease [Xenorhabdus littoralis]|uniref:CPBP family glutamic-type intramembrane protease n=1 Tax=Xenorhabdus littoralis TaxID=2582835 RepID=UPI0034DF87AA
MIFGNEETYYLQLIDNSSNSSILFLGFYVVILAPITEENNRRDSHARICVKLIFNVGKAFSINRSNYNLISFHNFTYTVSIYNTYIFSVILCYARMHSGGLKLPILLHVLANSSSVMFLLSY